MDSVLQSSQSSSVVQRPSLFDPNESGKALNAGKLKAASKMASLNTYTVTFRSMKKKKNQTKTITTLTTDAAATATGVDSVGVRMGLSLKQIGKGKVVSDYALNLDSLRYVDEEESLARKASLSSNSNSQQNNSKTTTTSTSMFQTTLENVLDNDFEGIVVSYVEPESESWNLGVREGDILVSTQATIGDNFWPKKTLDGVRSAISSRRVISNQMSFQFRKGVEASSSVLESQTTQTTTFEIVLKRPIGINVEDDVNDGYVKITKIANSNINQNNKLQIGDRVVAVDSTLGNQMWPVSTVEGLVSACTTRLPGQPVKLRIERVVELEEDVVVNTENENAVNNFETVSQQTTSTTTTSNVDTQQHELLLSRSRDLLRRYTSSNTSSNTSTSTSPSSSTTAQSRSALNSLPTIVADRILDTLSEASVPLDAKTLTMIMNAYLSTSNPEKAIAVFEAAIGISSDGSDSQPLEQQQKLHLVSNPAKALDLLSATSLLRAHALKGDLVSAQRVFAAMEGKEGFVVHGLPAISWSSNNQNQNENEMKPDLRCYNILLAAAAKAGGDESVQAAMDIFNHLNNDSTLLQPNQVTYNTLIGLFAKAGRKEDALNIFYTMKEKGFKPDKFSYTSLLKSLVDSGDFNGGQELLQEMKDFGVKPDIVTFNTIIKAMCDNLQWYKAQQVVQEMEQPPYGIQPNSLTYGLLMNGLLKAGKPSACLALFEGACADPKTMVLTENVHLYTTAITAASKLGNVERAIELISRMKKVGVKPNLKTLTALMSSALFSGRTDMALDVFDQILKLSEENNTSSNTSSYSNNTSQQFQVDGYVLTLALRAYCDTGDFENAANILSSQKDGLNELKGRDVMFWYNYLIKSALLRNEFQVAKDALTELLASGYIPSKATFEDILSSLKLDKISPNNNNNNNKIKSDIDNKTSMFDIHRETFEFLLFVIDSLNKRKLSINGTFYSAILREGVRLGGFGRQMAYLLGKAREEGNTNTILSNTSTSSSSSKTTEESTTWSNVLHSVETGQVKTKKYTRGGQNNKSDSESDSSSLLPLPNLKVTVNKREFRQVIAAESPVVYSARAAQRRNALMRRKR
eukprot:CAMPEP_0178956734 /NCGR_PEP_ID=MMETSP0789-20121207/10454_1 /TAXON_ID=3005 /ORGANISM="Rhizosolenia setigera, Strain CCMP 1694" /LENGTH=1089 /DNA_ID=CAMNT_0020638767 /DNA_START=279 /DNA_END=3548 /DNA_ORIENTATION=+